MLWINQQKSCIQFFLLSVKAIPILCEVIAGIKPESRRLSRLVRRCLNFPEGMLKKLLRLSTRLYTWRLD